MSRKTSSLADAKARLSEGAERAASGEEFLITKHGRPVTQLAPVRHEKNPLNVAAERALVATFATLPRQPESAADAVRRMRAAERH